MSEITPGRRADGLDSLLWGLPVAVYRSSPDGRLVAGNARLVDLLGAASMSEIIEIDTRKLYFDPAGRDEMMRALEPGQSSPPSEILLRRLDGSEVWVRESFHAVEGPEGTVAYIDGVFEDISARREEDRLLTESHRLLDAVTAAQNRFLTGVDIGVVFDDLLEVLLDLTASEYGFIAEVRGEGDERYLRSMAMTDIAWNEATREMYDRLGPRGMEFHNLETLFGRVVLDALPVISNDPISDPRRGGRPHGHPPLDSFLGLPVFKGPAVIAVVALANRPGGYTDQLADFLEPFLTTVGSIVEAIHERMARTEAEERERVRELRFHAVVEAAVDGVIVFDEHGTVEVFNPAAEQLFGYASHEIRGTNVRRLIPPELVVQYESLAPDLSGAGKPVEVTALHRSGDVFQVEVSLGKFRLDGRATFTALVRDIAERKVTEDALRRAKEAAERANRSKSDFLAGMSHELRTPLNGVIGLSSILRRGATGPLNDKQLEYVSQIEVSGRHLLSVINDVLDLAKIEAESLEPELAPVEVPSLVEQSLGIVRESATTKQVHLEVDLPPDLPPVLADERRLRQVLVNLLGNGIKFTPEGGTVGVTTTVVGEHIAIDVWDTGIGIPADRLEDVFLPFEQVEGSLDRSHEGTGLGLTLSRRLIEAQGGSIAVTSTVGEGSRFECRLPIARKAGEVPTPESSPVGGRHIDRSVRSKVLVVEDNDVNRMLITDYLEVHGLDVITAIDGDEAVARALDAAPDVILMDIQLPRRDGLSATRELKARDETRDIPVVALTALAMKGDADRCLSAGCDDYLSKPCDPALVLQVVERFLASA